MAFRLAKLTLERYFRRRRSAGDRPSVHRFDADVQGWLFPQLLAIAKRWLAECLTCKDRHVPAAPVARRVRARRRRPHLPRIVASARARRAEADPAPLRHRRLDALRRLRHDQAGLRRRDPTSATCRTSSPTRDVGAEVAQALEEMPEVVRYVKNQTRLHDSLHAQRRGAALLPRLHRRASTTATGGCSPQPDRRGHRRGAEGQGGEGRDGADAVGAGGEQSRRLRSLGVRRGDRSVGRRRAIRSALSGSEGPHMTQMSD